ncbi:hypothetical protein M426DRAFT_325389 [Hypoxylon sp. CI-4A]|nr:hypothetical protein M426DRAFT_325389 [Hypoxylon sp. CI-4A]
MAPKNRPRPQIGSLNAMASNIRDQKTTSATKLSGLNGSRTISSSTLAKSSSSDNESSSSSSDSDGSGSGSDSDGDLEAARKKYAAKQASKNKTAPRPKVNASKATSDAKKSPPAQSPAKATTTSPDDSESESDSDSGSESDSSKASNASAKKVSKEGPSKPKEQDQDGSDSGSSSESEDDDEPSTEKAAPQPAQKPQEAESSSSSESESDDGKSDSGSSDSGEESAEEDAMEVYGDETTVTRVNGETDIDSQLSRIAWLNNSEFALRKASNDISAKEVADALRQANLEGKQLWYFTAPASLPLTILRDLEIDLSKATTGEMLLNHKGDDYGLSLESHTTSSQIQLVIPTKTGDRYNTLDRSVDSTVHLRQIAKFGPNSSVSATATDAYTPIPKPIRNQPQGLKTRFTPIGVPSPQVQLAQPRPSQDVPSSAPESADVEMTTIPNSQPQSSGPAKKTKKSDAANGKLKRKQPSSEEQSSSVPESQSQEKSAKRPKTITKAAKPKETPIQAPTPAHLVPMPNGTSPSVSTPTRKPKKDSKVKYSATKPAKQTPVPVPVVPSMKR